MKEITFAEISQDEINDEAVYLIEAIRSRYPRLDLRKGTVLRELLINPDASIGSLFKKQMEECRNSSSIKRILDRFNEGEEIDIEDLNAVLSNFSITSSEGEKATGFVRVNVSSAAQYSVPKSFIFKTIDNIQYVSDKQIIASVNPTGDSVKLIASSTGFYFTVPVTCTTEGSIGNISAGTVLSAQKSIYGATSYEAFSDFSGGTDVEDLNKVVERIPESLSVRSLTTRTSIKSILSDRFSDEKFPLIDVSVCGYGSPEQLRDKHNKFGVSVGGRVDVYVKNFSGIPVRKEIRTAEPYTITKELTTENGSILPVGTTVYRIDFPAVFGDDKISGIERIISVSDAESGTPIDFAKSISYERAENSLRVHDFRITGVGPELDRDDTIELDGSAFGRRHLLLVDEEWTTDKSYVVEFEYLPGCFSMQEFMDSSDITNIDSDIIVRCPRICTVSVSSIVHLKKSTKFHKSDAISKIVSFINESGFIGVIPGSKIVEILIGCGAASVDIDGDTFLMGVVTDAAGAQHILSGTDLDVSTIRNTARLLSENTVVFVTTPNNISISEIID